VRSRVLVLCTHDVASAGTVATAVHPLAARVMVITVCDQAGERCPLFPGPARRIHWGFEDPSAATGSGADRLATFRRVRDAIRDRLRAWLAEGPAGAAP
jgi:arsenate reductase (thioredoxin)